MSNHLQDDWFTATIQLLEALALHAEQGRLSRRDIEPLRNVFADPPARAQNAAQIVANTWLDIPHTKNQVALLQNTICNLRTEESIQESICDGPSNEPDTTTSEDDVLSTDEFEAELAEAELELELERLQQLADIMNASEQLPLVVRERTSPIALYTGIVIIAIFVATAVILMGIMALPPADAPTQQPRAFNCGRGVVEVQGQVFQFDAFTLDGVCRTRNGTIIDERCVTDPDNAVGACPAIVRTR